VHKLRLVDLLNQGLKADRIAEEVLEEGETKIAPVTELLLLGRHVVVPVKTRAVAVSRAFRKVVAYPFGCVKQIKLNLLSIRVDAFGWLVRRCRRVGGGVGRVEK
jgi:hypothetical protein